MYQLWNHIDLLLSVVEVAIYYNILCELDFNLPNFLLSLNQSEVYFDDQCV